MKKYLELAGIDYHINTNLVRGLDYYTHTVFEIISDKDNLYTIEDGKRWLEIFFKSELKKKWNFLFNFLPKKLYDNQVKRSAIISLLLASLNNVKNGKIEMNQQKHFDKIMIKEKL